MRCLGLVVPGLHQGGGVPSVAQFIRDAALHSRRWRVLPVSLCMASRDAESTSMRDPRSWLRAPMMGVRNWLGVEVPYVGARLGELEFQRYRPRRALSALLRQCDVIQVVAGSPTWANAVVGLGKPVALQVATLARVERRQRRNEAIGLVGRWRKAMTTVTSRLDERALRRVDAIQVENPWMFDYAQRANARRQGVDIRYAPPGIETALFHPLAMRDLTDDPYILCVGRLDDPRKCVGLLLEAYARLTSELRSRVRLVLAGAAGPPGAFWSRAAALGVRERIAFVARPDQSALVELYQHAALFALPSDEEGFGVVVIEAMACGVPVVSTRSGGPDGIITDGVDGFLVERGDAGTFAGSMTRLLTDLGQNAAMGVHARATVERRYARDVAGAAFLDVWDGLLRRARC